MKVCIDIQAAIAQTAGVGRYTRRLIEHLAPLAEASGAPPLRLFYFDFRRMVEPPSIPGTLNCPARHLPGRLIQGAWRLLKSPDFASLAGMADVYHFPNFTVPPLSRGRVVLTIHDVSFLRFPQFTESRNLQRLTAMLPRSLARADTIVTISRFSAAEIAESLSVDPARIQITYPGVDAHFQPADGATVAAMRQTLGLERPYLLSVGTIEPRKNHIFLAELFEHIGNGFDGLLAIAGAPGWQTQPILDRLRRSPRAGAIRILSHVPEPLLPALYSDAAAFLFPSHYEGFGLPPLEALACGAPVIVSEGGALPEVLDTPAVTHPGALDVEAWAAALRALLAEDSDRRAARRAAGRSHAAGYAWQDTARQTWEIYRSLCPC